MNATYSLNIYEILFPVIKSEAKTKELVQNIELVIDKKFDENKNTLATKLDLAEVKSDMIKWMFLFWIGQIGVTFGFILLFLKK
jgi:hypothetical protein